MHKPQEKVPSAFETLLLIRNVPFSPLQLSAGLHVVALMRMPCSLGRAAISCGSVEKVVGHGIHENAPVASTQSV